MARTIEIVDLDETGDDPTISITDNKGSCVNIFVDLDDGEVRIYIDDSDTPEATVKWGEGNRSK